MIQAQLQNHPSPYGRAPLLESAGAAPSFVGLSNFQAWLLAGRTNLLRRQAQGANLWCQRRGCAHLATSCPYIYLHNLGGIELGCCAPRATPASEPLLSVNITVNTNVLSSCRAAAAPVPAVPLRWKNAAYFLQQQQQRQGTAAQPSTTPRAVSALVTTAAKHGPPLSLSSLHNGFKPAQAVGFKTLCLLDAITFCRHTTMADVRQVGGGTPSNASSQPVCDRQ